MQQCFYTTPLKTVKQCNTFVKPSRYKESNVMAYYFSVLLSFLIVNITCFDIYNIIFYTITSNLKPTGDLTSRRKSLHSLESIDLFRFLNNDKLIIQSIDIIL